MIYTPPVGGASNDPYIDANPGGGIDGSIVPAQAIEDPQREIVAVIVAAGLTPSAGTLNQLLAAIQSFQLIPAGVVLDFGGAAAPAGYLLCNGAAVSRATYTALFAAIGTTFGVGDGATTFNVPDARGRTRIGTGTGAGLTARGLGGLTGVETHPLVTGEMPAHTHTFEMRGDFSGPSNTRASQGDAGGTTSQFPATSSAGSGTAHENMQPSIVCTAIIKT